MTTTTWRPTTLRRRLALVLGVLVALAGTGGLTLRPAAAADVAGVASLVDDGAWCWFQDPRAVHHVGARDRTYVGYVTSTGDIDVVSADNGTGQLVHTTLHPAFQADDHASPGIVVLPNGIVAVFYSAHGGQQMFYRLSVRPEDVSAFGPERTVGTNTVGTSGYTYANPIYLPAEGRTYLFFRSADNRPAVTWSADLRTWSKATDLIYPDKSGAAARPYVKYGTNGRDAISIAFNDGHPRDVPTNSVYVAVLRGGVLHSADGTPLAAVDPARVGGAVTPLPLHSARLRPVYDGAGAGGKAWVHSTALDADSRPVVAYATFPRDTTPTDTDHRYRYAAWNGTAWNDREFARAGGSIATTGGEDDYSGGMDLDHNDPSVLYAARQVGSVFEVERWHTPDLGRTFEAPTRLTPGATEKNVRPVVPWGPPGDVKVLWMSGRYDHWRAQYRTRVRMLTSGPYPTTARISVSGTAVTAGAPVRVAARWVQGYQGPSIPGGTATLYASVGGGSAAPVATARTDSSGLASFDVRPTRATRYEVRLAAVAPWSAATTPPVDVVTAKSSAARLSVDRTTIRRGQPVVVGMRVVDAVTNVGLAGVRVALWQTVDGTNWMSAASVVTDATGLARVTRYPTVPVRYQARFTGGAGYGPSASGTIRVVVTA
ncbi:MAG: hypothetical protein QOC80_607 [Frankiaceae bacterium]|nr:hypothetical protein [Frankiaceae bacterium]